MQGTNGDDSIAAQNLNESNRVWVNDRAVVTFVSFDNLTLQGRFGDDHISVTPMAGVAVLVSGGDPNASDKLVVNATAGNDTIGYNATGLGTGTVTVNALPAITFNTIEALYIDGQGGTDALTHTTPAGGDLVTYTPGAAPTPEPSPRAAQAAARPLFH